MQNLAVLILTVNVSLLLRCSSYSIPPTGIRSVSEVDSMVRQCFQTMCKEWMVECHWYCDSVRDQKTLHRCQECLSYRGQQCMDCFDL